MRENKSPAPTREKNSWSICQLSCCYTSKYAQTNLIYQRPLFSRDLYWPIKFQIFCDRTINSPYIYAPKHQTKINLHSRRDSLLSRICKKMKWCEPEIRFIWLMYNLVGTLVILSQLFQLGVMVILNILKWICT